MCTRVANLKSRGFQYANKHWNGLVGDFYKARVQCYVDQVKLMKADAESFDTAKMTECAIKAELAFTQGTDKQYSEVPTADKTLPMSKMLLDKYKKYF